MGRPRKEDSKQNKEVKTGAEVVDSKEVDLNKSNPMKVNYTVPQAKAVGD